MAEDSLKDKVNIAIQEGIKKASEKIAFDIQGNYEHFIQMFYDDYEPNSYNRTLNTFFGSDGTSLDKMINDIKNGYIVGIAVSSDNIPGDPYSADKDWVFDRTYYEGIHGFTPTEYKDWSNRDTVSQPMANASKIPTQMKPSPSVLMNKWFNNYKKKDVKNIVNSCINESLSKYL